MFIFDAHCDTLSTGQPLWENDGQFDVMRASARGSGAQLMAAFGLGQLRQLERFHKESFCAPPGFTLLPAVEGGDTIRSIGDMDAFLAQGIRSFGLTWNHDNALAGGCMGTGLALTKLGAEVVALLEEHGVCVDLAHASQSAFYETLACAKMPVAVTHACCAALCPHPRNLDDSQLRALAHNGGVLGIAFHKPFLTKDKKATINDVAAHILHACHVMGEAHVGLGSDFDGGITAPEGLAGTEDIPALLERLPASIRAAVAGQNFQRLFGLQM